MVIRDVCPQCKSPQFTKNGHIHSGKQNHHCHDCGRQFVQCCEPYLISEEKGGFIERLLVERISLRGICRAVGVTPGQAHLAIERVFRYSARVTLPSEAPCIARRTPHGYACALIVS